MRFMRVDLKLKLINSKSKIKPHTISLVSNYHPHSGYKDDELDAYMQDNMLFLDALIGTRKTTTTIDSAKDNNIINNLIGPHRNPHRNHRGEPTLNMLRQLNF